MGTTGGAGGLPSSMAIPSGVVPAGARWNAEPSGPVLTVSGAAALYGAAAFCTRTERGVQGQPVLPSWTHSWLLGVEPTQAAEEPAQTQPDSLHAHAALVFTKPSRRIAAPAPHAGRHEVKTLGAIILFFGRKTQRN